MQCVAFRGEVGVSISLNTPIKGGPEGQGSAEGTDAGGTRSLIADWSYLLARCRQG